MHLPVCVKNKFQIETVRKRVALIALLVKQRKIKKHRSIYIRELFKKRRLQGEYFLLGDLEDDPLYHKKYFRMDKESFEKLLELVAPKINHPPTHGYPIPPAARLAIALRYFATGCSQVQLALSFRISPAVVSQIVREVTQALNEALTDYLPPPSHQTWIDSELAFREKWQFPFCLGAIDGKHVRIRSPKNSGSSNFNYKGFFSIVILAVVSGDYKFLVTDIGAPGSESDAGIFARSTFAKRIEEKTLQIPLNGKLGANETEVSYVIVGDEAFPLKPWLMRPFPGRGLDLQKKIFNYRLSRARRVVENVFGIWATRWRILFSTMECDVNLCQAIVRCTVLLHNFLRDVCDPDVHEDRENADGTVEPGNWRDMGPGGELVDIPRVGSNNYSLLASRVRDTFLEYFVSEEGSLPGQEIHVMRS